jgi:DNA sulfur modification protein DndB
LLDYIAKIFRPFTSMKESAYFEFLGIKGKQGALLQFATTWSLSIVLRLLSPIAKKAINDPVHELDLRFIDCLAADLSDPDFCLSYSPIVVGVSSPIEFTEDAVFPTCGKVKIPISAMLHIVDGTHRVAALIKANLPRSRLISDTIPVVLLSNPDERQLQNARDYFQKYHQENLISKSRRTLVSRTMREMTKDLLIHSRFLGRAVEIKSSSLAPRSLKLLTLSGLTKGSTPIFNILRKSETDNAVLVVASYWDYLSQLLKPWHEYLHNQANASEVRNSTILSSATVVSALGHLGAYLFETKPDSWKQAVDNLAMLDWSKKPSSIWEGRALEKGTLMMGKKAELLSCNLMKLTCGCALQPEEEACEVELQQITNKSI